VEKHLLVTISEEKSALYGVRFVGRFFTNAENLRLTLFASAPQAPDVMGTGLGYEGKLRAEEYDEQARRRSQEAVDRARNLLRERGFPRDSLEGKVASRRFSKVMDIVQEAEAGMYDAVVLGRRGLGRLEEALEQSVSQGLLQESMTIPLWICRMPEINRKNVLACVDGSVPAYQAVDHAAFMLADEPGHNLTLFKVNAPGVSPDTSMGDGEDETIFAKALEICKNNGLDASRVSTRVIHETSVAPSILAEVERGRYAAVAVGHSGRGRRLMGRFLFGSVSTTLLRQLMGAALWVCR
jgi:nucleotide-binding universal stress UspA family protein